LCIVTQVDWHLNPDSLCPKSAHTLSGSSYRCTVDIDCKGVLESVVRNYLPSYLSIIHLPLTLSPLLWIGKSCVQKGSQDGPVKMLLGRQGLCKCRDRFPSRSTDTQEGDSAPRRAVNLSLKGQEVIKENGIPAPGRAQGRSRESAVQPCLAGVHRRRGEGCEGSQDLTREALNFGSGT
jgi:hypothetical protein